MLTPERDMDGPMTQVDVRLILGDCLEVLKDLPSGSVDAVVTDPPYGIGIAAWDSTFDAAAFTIEVRRILTTDGFYAFTGQMPSITDWHIAAMAERFHFCEHVVWVKRLITPGVRLGRTHESIYVYAAGGRKRFHITKGPYEDVKLPGLYTGTYTVEALDRHIKDLQAKVAGRSDGAKPASTARQSTFDRYALFGGGDRSPETVNYSNAWSFLPPSCATRDGLYSHPTEKPLPLMERLVEMLTPEGATVLDPFMGSGTTGVACVQTGRNFIGIEIDPTYFAIAERRIEEARQQLRMPL